MEQVAITAASNMHGSQNLKAAKCIFLSMYFVHIKRILLLPRAESFVSHYRLNLYECSYLSSRRKQYGQKIRPPTADTHCFHPTADEGEVSVSRCAANLFLRALQVIFAHLDADGGGGSSCWRQVC